MPNALTKKHFELFGGIVYNYAFVELGFKFCTAAVMQCSPHDVLVLTSRQPAQVIAENLRALARDSLKDAPRSQLIQLISRWAKHNDLRTSIAHHRWREGSRPGSVRPAYYSVRSGKTKVVGFEDDETDYLIEDLEQVCAELARLKDDLDAFMRDSGLEAIIKRKMAEESAAQPSAETSTDIQT